jgi:hypothetical protein
MSQFKLGDEVVYELILDSYRRGVAARVMPLLGTIIEFSGEASARVEIPTPSGGAIKKVIPLAKLKLVGPEPTWEDS